MSSKYEVSAFIAFIMSSPTYDSNIIGILIQGTEIDVINVTDGWAYFNYNDADAYVQISTLAEVDSPTTETKGTVTIEYIDIATDKTIASSQKISNLTLGTYTYTAKTISGYSIEGDSSQTVTITEDEPNQTITFKYKEILGSVTIEYISESTSLSISTSEIYSDLKLGTYTYIAKTIADYTIVGDSSQSVTLTENEPNQTITFKYKEILGSVTIEYISESTSLSISTSEIYSDLKLGTYTYTAKTIADYTIVGDSSQSVTLTENDSVQTITFKYKKISTTPDDSDVNMNEVPYISTYYIKPVVTTDEEVIINYYITDYFFKEYLNEDTSEAFTVTVRVNDEKETVYTDLLAGDHQVSLGKFTTEGEQKFSLLCTDKYGRESHELFNFFLVRNGSNNNEYVMTEDDLTTYNIKNVDNYEVKKIIDLSSLSPKDSTTVKAALVKAATKITPASHTYVCVIADTVGNGEPGDWWAENQVVYASDYDKDAVLLEATNTRTGLQKLLDDKKTAGYNKLILLAGNYRIDHKEPIYIPTGFTLDMNGATIKQNQFTGDKSLMMTLNNTVSSHVMNGLIVGDYFSHDYSASTNNSEWVNGISIASSAMYSSFENMTVKDITGYGSTNGIASSQNGKLGYTYLSPRGIGNTFVLGDIDLNTGEPISSTTRTTCDFRDITGYSEIGYLSVSVYLGYQGNPCGTWNIICHFYDEDKSYIKSTPAYQYRRVAVPSTAKYMKVTILNKTYPTNLCILYFRMPTNCEFNNITHNNCRCVGAAPMAMNNMMFNSCDFNNCGQSSAKCAVDTEDGWDLMQDTTFRNNSFTNNPNNDFLTCDGHNFIVDGQKGGKMYIWPRTRALVVKNCDNVEMTLQGGGVDDIVEHSVYRVYDNTLGNSSVADNLIKNNTCTTVSGLVYNCSLTGLASNSTYTSCSVTVSNVNLGYIDSLNMADCNITPDKDFTERYSISFDGGHGDSYNFENCNFYGMCNLNNHVKFYSGNFKNSYFEDVTITPNVQSKESDLISFDKCTINYSDTNLIYYAPAAYTKGTYTHMVFTDCTITKTTTSTKHSLIYAYAKPNGYCKFEGCTISIPDKTIIFDGYPTNISYITGYTVDFIDSPLPDDVTLISEAFKSNSNIQVVTS